MSLKSLFDRIRSDLFQGALDGVQVNGIELMVKEARRRRLSQAATAYILATAYHETGATMRPVEESLNYSEEALRKQWPKHFTAADAKRWGRNDSHPANQEAIADKAYGGRMGNGPPSSGDGWRFRGRGFAQITGRDNYERMDARLGLGGELVNNPSLALRPDIATKIIFEGMLDGVFTGLPLRTFTSKQPPDYEGARAVVNSNDKANQIAEYARTFDRGLDGIDLLADSNTVTVAKEQKRTGTSGIVATAGAGATVVADALVGDADNVTEALAIGGQLSSYLPWLGGALIVVALLSFLYLRKKSNVVIAEREAIAERM